MPGDRARAGAGPSSDKGLRMTAIRCLTLGVAVAFASFAAADDDKKPADDMLVGKWKVTDGKKAGTATFEIKRKK